MSEQEQAYAGKLVQHSNNGDKDLMGWHYEATTRFELPLNVAELSVALVDRELIYIYENGKWVFDAVQTYSLHFIQQEENGTELITSLADPVAGIDFSSKPRNEWTIGNWIAHVGGGIRSDHFVVFGSVMAVDTMVRQIIRNVLGVKKQGVSLTFSGGTEQQRALLATTIAGIMNPLPVNPGYNLQKYVDQQAEESLTEEQSVVIMEAIARSGGINIEFVADKPE